MEKRVFLFLVFGVVVLVLLGINRSSNKDVQTKASAPLVLPVEETLMEVANGEGNMKLVGTERGVAGGQTSYSFKVVDLQKKTDWLLYETVADQGNSISIPMNSWSPDYKQVFLKTTTPDGDDYFLFKTNGEIYSDGKRYLSVGEYWKMTKSAGQTIKITGWAGDDQLMVYTDQKEGGVRTAYWFVTSLRKFVQVKEF